MRTSVIAHRPIEHIIAGLARDIGLSLSLDEESRVSNPRTNQDVEAQAAPPLPTEPRPTRTTAPIHLTWYCQPGDNEDAVAMVLAPGKIRDG